MKVSSKRGERGIALILVIGLISVLMISAVAFAISMRVERQGSYNYRYGVQARHILWSALAEALQEIDATMDPASTTNSMMVYPEWDVIASKSESATLPRKARVLSISGVNYVPQNSWTAARAAIPYYRNVTGTNDWKIGRYAYIAVNMSGLLDANLAGGAPARSGGASPSEIQIDQLPEIFGHGSQFTTVRAAQMGRYDSLFEMTNLNAAVFVGPVNNMALYSLARNDEVLPIIDTGGAAQKKVWIGGSVADLKAREAEIKNAFTACGVVNPDLAYWNLLEYVDDNFVPDANGVGEPSLGGVTGKDLIEPVPMFNDFTVLYSCTYSHDSAGASNFVVSSVSVIPVIEIVYLFDQDNNRRYQLKYNVSITTNMPASAASLLPLDPNQAPFVPTINPPTEETYPSTFLGKESAVPSYRVYALKALPGGGGSTAPCGQVRVAFCVNFSGYITEVGGSRQPADRIVDQVPVPWNDSQGIKAIVNFTVTTPGGTVVGQSVTQTNWIECIDPRFNSLPGAHWIADLAQKSINSLTGHSMKKINNITEMFFKPTVYRLPPNEINDYDDDTLMYSANKPLLTVGELGYICYGTWRTIRLYDHKATGFPSGYPDGRPVHPVFDYFMVTNKNYVRGLVNINTTNLNVLASVFSGVPNKEYSPTASMPWINATSLATEISTNGPYYNVSSMVTSITWASVVSNFVVNPSEIEKESILRNSADLLTVRHNLFTIYLLSDSYIEGSGNSSGTTLASARAVAEVWRDPFRDPANGNKHKYLIRQFKLLDE
ncbi:MAG: hypothetical protein A2283_04385 [Lentisphaerae bacterium RIFOXYA12_FULL_48_11]|nr:MAG: hypothetical protein A2283_04385 [Lentisphaerae bacterium RIFOXYA12_FULL_48_11]